MINIKEKILYSAWRLVWKGWDDKVVRRVRNEVFHQLYDQTCNQVSGKIAEEIRVQYD